MTARSSTTALRIVIAGLVIADLLSLVVFIADARGRALLDGTDIGGVAGAISWFPVCAAIAAVGIAGAVAFARRPGRLRAGLVPLAALALLSTAHAHLVGSPWRHLFFSGICLTGWLLGLAVTRRAGAPHDESYAYTGALALLGTAYLSSGISKVVYGGAIWLTGFPIQALVVGQNGLPDDSAVTALRLAIVTTPAIAAVFSILTVVFELSGPLLLAGRRWRRAVAFGLIGMHTTIFLLTPVLYWESTVLLFAFAVAPDPPSPGDLPQPLPALLVDRGRFTRTAAIVAAGAIIAIAYQAVRAAYW
jgi:hypothetical protein